MELATLTACLIAGCDAPNGQNVRQNVGIQMQAANAAMQDAEYSEALQRFQEILSADSNNVPAWLGTGQAYSELGEWQQAEPAFAEACRLSPASYEAQYGHGTSLQQLNRPAEAVGAYHRAMTIDPLSSDASLGVGISYLQMDEPQHAKPFVERAVELSPADGRTWVALGALLEREGDDPAALDAYLAASERLESSPELKRNLLYAYARAGRYHEVVGTARSILSDGPSADAAERMAWAWFRLGRYERSAEAYIQAIQFDPNMWQAWNGLGVNAVNRWLLSGKTDADSRAEAVTAFKASLQLNTSQPKVVQLVSEYGLSF
ncbi:MAG: tetratricopeptide repeat protein [Phycisphaerales bacterium]|nr:tetratricopeptide repeat protein [Phycisphaerales bacterium]